MAVSILRRPYGYVRTSNEGTGSVNESGGVPGVVNIVSTAHGIADGATIYLKCPIENYNGFVLIEVADANNFRLKDVEGNYIDYLTGTAGTEVSFFVHNTAITWNCVHLPIVYKLSNTLWPTNSVDTIRTISAVTDSNGYCSMTASGDIKATGSAAALEFVKITGSTDDDLNGVWQIITYSSDTSFVLDIPYSSANDTALTGASIQYYYNNYVTKVQIWGGLNNGHEYYAQEPYSLLATLDLIPDENNICMFSIAEILKKNVAIKNNLLLGTLPNNLDAWTGFFIKYAEEYDDSDGTTLSRSTVSYTSDLNTFEGYAANAMLPFKNVYSGALSEYVSGDSAQKFLTNWEQPTIFTGKYLDLSFINNALFDSFSNPALSTFINQSSGTLWTTGATPSITLADGASSALLSVRFTEVFKSGITYRVGVSITYTGTSTTVLTTSIENASNTNVNFIQSFLNNGVNVITVDLVSAGDYHYFVFQVVDVAGGGAGSYTLNNYWIYPVDDTDFAKVYLKEDDTVTLMDVTNEGVYRVPLSDPDCDNETVEVKLLKVPIEITPVPADWTDNVAWTSYQLRTFTYIDASAPYALQPESYFTLDVEAGDIMAVDVTLALTGTYNGTITVSSALTNGPNTVISTPNPNQTTLTTGQTVTLSSLLTATATVAGARFNIIVSVGAGTGDINLVMTIPPTYVLISDNPASETKTIDIDCDCVPSQAEEGIYLSWLNNLGGFDYWLFTAYKDHIINITDSGETKVNTFPNWPVSYGEFADTIRKQTFRDSETQILVRSQHLTKDQITQIQSIKTSPLVQIVNSIYDRRTVLVDTDSFTVYQEEQKLYQIQFTITYTDDVPSQRV
jgi:hypothetical protein